MYAVCYIVIYDLSRSTIYFSTLSHKRYDFRKEVTEYGKCVLIFFTTFVRIISHSKKNLAKFYRRCTYVFM